MAVVVFKSKTDDTKPKKEFIDLSVEHKRQLNLSHSYKTLLVISASINLILSCYIIFYG